MACRRAGSGVDGGEARRSPRVGRLRAARTLRGVLTPELLLVHYHEIGLKGRNRPLFERALQRNLTRALDGRASGVRRVSGRMEIWEPEAGALERVERVFGVANVAPAVVAPIELDAIVRRGVEVAADAEAVDGFATFAVRARRARTSFDHTSQELNEALGDAIRVELGKRVDLGAPDLTVRVEVVENRAYVSARKVAGPGGLPVGTTGTVLGLLSAGIDSPVATWRVMKRGADPVPVHFHGRPFTDLSSEHKVAKLIEVLARWGCRRDWWSVPLGEAQREITGACDPSLRLLLYRRLMLRVAERIAAQVGALGIVTGESLGQVASQTLENLGAVERVATLPVFRPLLGHDKTEIIAEAERIGTFEISAQSHQDCCTLFEPRNPATRATAEQLDAAEADYDVGALVDDCLARAVQRPV